MSEELHRQELGARVAEPPARSGVHLDDAGVRVDLKDQIGDVIDRELREAERLLGAQ